MDKALKQRLVGASVLVALAVVVLPMLLSGQPETQQETRSIAVPPRPSELSFETRRFPVGDQDAAQAARLEPTHTQAANEAQALHLPAGSTDSAKQGGTEDSSPPEPQKLIGEQGAEAQTGAGPEPSTQTPADADDSREQKPQARAGGVGRYLVQVASFSSVSNANRLAGRLREDGMPVLMDNIETNAGILHRVRVGPFDQAQGADRAVAAIRARIPDLNPRVTDLRPDESAPVTVPSDPLVRWVVQVGNFAEAANAEKLVYRLRDAGYRASSVTVTSATGTVYKVRVGPEIERQNAVRLAEKLRQEFLLSGLVMSTD